MKSICFTGHRKISEDTKTLSQKLYKKLEKAINDGVTDFYAGGAIGWDTLAAFTVIELRKNYPYIKLHLVIRAVESQVRKWKETDTDYLLAQRNEDFLAINGLNANVIARAEEVVFPAIVYA